MVWAVVPFIAIVEAVEEPVSVMVPPVWVKLPLTFKIPVPADEDHELILSVPELIVTLPFTVNVTFS